VAAGEGAETVDAGGAGWPMRQLIVAASAFE